MANGAETIGTDSPSQRSPFVVSKEGFLGREESEKPKKSPIKIIAAQPEQLVVPFDHDEFVRTVGAGDDVVEERAPRILESGEGVAL